MMTPGEEQQWEALKARLARLRSRGSSRRQRTPGRVQYADRMEYRSRPVGNGRMWTDQSGRVVPFDQLPKAIRDAVGTDRH